MNKNNNFKKVKKVLAEWLDKSRQFKRIQGVSYATIKKNLAVIEYYADGSDQNEMASYMGTIFKSIFI